MLFPNVTWNKDGSRRWETNLVLRNGRLLNNCSVLVYFAKVTKNVLFLIGRFTIKFICFKRYVLITLN